MQVASCREPTKEVRHVPVQQLIVNETYLNGSVDLTVVSNQSVNGNAGHVAYHFRNIINNQNSQRIRGMFSSNAQCTRCSEESTKGRTSKQNIAL